MSLKIKHKRSGALNSPPTAAQIEQGEIGINYNKDSLTLYVKDSDGVIRAVAGDGSQGPGKSTAQATTPASPADGDLWIDTSKNPPELKLWDATASKWVEVGGRYTYPGGVDQTVQARLEQSASVKDFGAKGDGVTDDRTAIEAALVAIEARGGGTLVFPEPEPGNFYLTNRPIKLQPNVSLKGTGNKPMIKNVNTGTTMAEHMLFWFGNFHPDFLSKTRKYPLSADVQAGSSTVTTSHASNFAVGDQVALVSNEYGTSGTFGIPVYLILSNVVGAVGNTITLDTPSDVSFSANTGDPTKPLLPYASGLTPDFGGGIIKLSENPGRALAAGQPNDTPLFFMNRITVENLDLQNSNKNLLSDSASLGCTFINTRYGGTIYGNCWQYAKFSNVDFNCPIAVGGEFSETSMNVLVENCVFSHTSRPGTAFKSGGWSMQEFGRKIRFSNCIFNLGEITGTGSLVTNNACQDVVFDNCVWTSPYDGSSLDATVAVQQFTAGGGPFVITDPTTMSSTKTHTFPRTNNVIQNSTFNIARIGRVYNGVFDDPNDRDNGLKNCQFNVKTCAQPEAVVIEGDQAVVMENNRFNVGDKTVKFVASSTNNTFANNYISGGFQDETSTTKSSLANNCYGNTSDRWNVLGELYNKTYVSSVFCASNATTGVYSADIGDALFVADSLNIAAFGSIQNTGGSVQFNLYVEPGSGSRIDLLNAIIPSSNPGDFSVIGTTYSLSSTFTKVVYTITYGTTADHSVDNVAVPLSGSYTVKAEIICGSSVTCQFTNLNIRPSNPIYRR